jgi:solute carrier family 35 protein F1/2
MKDENVSLPEKAKNDVEMYSRWQILAFGQGLSVLLAVMWGSQSMLFLRCNWKFPAFSCGWAYVLLSFFLIPLIKKGRAIRNGSTASPVTSWFLSIIPLHTSPWVYLGIAFLSFYGNYCYLLAVEYTTVTSVSLVDALSIPTAMILSHIFLRRRYQRLHLLGAGLCVTGVMLGMVVDVLSNYIYRQESMSSLQVKTMTANVTNTSSSPGVRDDGSKEYPHKLVGDLLSCVGAILFGANDVIAELAVRRLGGINEYLGMIGFFGSVIAIFQVAISERQVVVDMFNGVNPSGCGANIVAGLLVAYVVGQFSRKAGLAAFLTISDAALLQLSLLTSDLYAALFSVIYLQILPRASSWFAILAALVGIVVYELAPSPRVDLPSRPVQMIQSDGTLVQGDQGNESGPSTKMV